MVKYLYVSIIIYGVFVIHKSIYLVDLVLSDALQLYYLLILEVPLNNKNHSKLSGFFYIFKAGIPIISHP